MKPVAVIPYVIFLLGTVAINAAIFFGYTYVGCPPLAATAIAGLCQASLILTPEHV